MFVRFSCGDLSHECFLSYNLLLIDFYGKLHFGEFVCIFRVKRPQYFMIWHVLKKAILKLSLNCIYQARFLVRDQMYLARL